MVYINIYKGIIYIYRESIDKIHILMYNRYSDKTNHAYTIFERNWFKMARYYMWTWASGIITVARSYSKTERKEKEKEYGKLISKKFHGYYKK